MPDREPSRETLEALLKDIDNDAKPLHVRVAEALGWTGMRGISGIAPDAEPVNAHWPISRIPRYDLDWQYAGPIIEKYRFLLGYEIGGAPEGKWLAEDERSGHDATGDTPLEAVCKLILVLHAAGKLKAA